MKAPGLGEQKKEAPSKQAAPAPSEQAAPLPSEQAGTPLRTIRIK